MEEIVEHSEDESDSEDSYVDGIYSFSHRLLYSVHCSAVSFRSEVPEAEFPEYVRLMHEDRDHRLELEYRVRLTADLHTLVYMCLLAAESGQTAPASQ